MSDQHSFRSPHPIDLPKFIQYPDRDTDTVRFSPKVTLKPNRISTPLPLAVPVQRHDAFQHIQNTQLFDDFRLDGLFSNRNPTPAEMQVLNQPKPITEYRHPQQHETGGQLGRGEADKESPHDRTKKMRPKEKGLRRLSLRAYQIVVELRNATYKEVATRLVEEFVNDKDLNSEEKEEKNIKRRVYDALNVLIASNVLRKEGRKISRNESARVDPNHFSHKTMQRMLRTQKQSLARLRNEVSKLTDIRQLMHLLQNRNYRNQESDIHIPRLRVPIPFIVLDSHSNCEVTQPSAVHAETRLEVRWQGRSSDKQQMDLEWLRGHQGLLFGRPL